MKSIRQKIDELLDDLLRVPSYKDTLRKSLNHECSPTTRLSILDIGGAGGKLWADMKCSCIHLTIIDPWIPEEEFEELADSRIVGTFQEVSKSLSSQTFDLVVAMDVIEHLPVSDGYLLLYEMARLSKGRLSVYTPSGFLWQPPSENNSFNAHVSGWSIKELKRFGFTKFRAHVGLRLFWGPYSLPKHSFANKWFVVLSLVGNNIIKIFPALALTFSAEANSENFPSSSNQAI